MDTNRDDKGKAPSGLNGPRVITISRRAVTWTLAIVVILFLFLVSLPNIMHVNQFVASRGMVNVIQMPEEAAGGYSGMAPSPPPGDTYVPSNDRAASQATEEVSKLKAMVEESNVSGYYRVRTGANEAESASDSGSSATGTLSSIFSQSAYAQEASVPGVKPMIVYNGSLTLKVIKLKDSADAVVAMLPKYNGYVSNMSENTSGTSQMVTITVRVDAAKVMSFVDEVKKLGEILSSELAGDEVTEEYVDLQAQLDALKLSEARLKDMLAKSGKLSDLQQIEQELTNRQSSINEVTGRMRYLRDRSQMATVTITLQTEAPPPPTTVLFSWDFGQTFQQAWLSLKLTIRNILNSLIVMAVFAILWLPIIAVIILILWWIYRRMRRRVVFVWSDKRKP